MYENMNENNFSPSKFTVGHDLATSWVQISAQGGTGDYLILV